MVSDRNRNQDARKFRFAHRGEADVAGRMADRDSFGSSAIVDACGTVVRVGRVLSEDSLVAEVHTNGQESRSRQACRVQ
jgi:hypothetical protein